MKTFGKPIIIMLLFFISMVIFAFNIGTVTAVSDQSVIYVNGTSGNDNWDGTSPIHTSDVIGPKKTIKNATGTVQINGTIQIASGIYKEQNITIKNNMDIIGENQKNTIIDAQQLGRIFIIPTGIKLKITNLRFTNGNSTDGGAIHNSGTLNVNICMFNFNTAPRGGAVTNKGTSLITNTIFDNNIAKTYEAGAIYNRGNLTSARNIFTNNKAITGAGAVYNYNLDNLFNVSLYKDSFINNSVLGLQNNGGAVYNLGLLNITNTLFENNIAPVNGGVIVNGEYRTSINSVLTSINNKFINNSAKYSGVIYNYQGTLIIENNIFRNNQAECAGGVIRNLFLGTLIVTNSIFSNNIATTMMSGAIHNYGILVVNTSNFNNNTAVEGGALSNFGNATLDENIFYGNIAIDQGGGAIITAKGTAKVTNSTFSNNTSKGGGGAIHNSNIVENYTGNLIVDKCLFKFNKATDDSGGAIKNGKGNSTVTNSNFSNNSGVAGGAIINLHGNTTLNKNIFSDNVATLFGGGAVINGQSSLEEKSNLIITNCDFTNNSAERSGGAIMNDNTGYAVTKSYIKIINSTLTGNEAINYDGGALRNSGGTLTVTQSILANNTAATYGGALSSIDGNSNVVNNTFLANIATTYGGGAIFNKNNLGTDLRLTDRINTFINNKAPKAGAIYNDNLGIASVINDTFINNTATNGNGGAILNSGSSNINYCSFNYNSATKGNGGAISNYRTLIVTNCGFTNTQAINGGVIYNLNLGTITVNYNTFNNNYATKGRIIYNDGGNVAAHFNRILGSYVNYYMYNRVGTMDARYNWWGSNSNPSATVFNSNIGPWLVLTVTANPDTISQGASSIIIADFLHDSNGVYHDPSEGYVPNGMQITFNLTDSTIGTINPFASRTNEGISETTFYAIKNGETNITAKIDYQLVSTTITVI